MNGIIFRACSTLAISVLQIVLKWCRKERKKIQVKKESQQSRNRWWMWPQKARGKPDMKVNFLRARELSSIKEQGDLLKTLTHQATQNGNLIKLGLPKWKCDELMEVRTGRPVLFAQHTDRIIVENDNMDSYTEAESEMSRKSRSFLRKVNDQVWKRQYQCSKDATKDSDKHSVIWKMFTQTLGIPSRIQKISQWNRCSTNERNWYPNNQTRSMEWIQLTGKILHGSICLWLVMKKSSVSRTQRFTYFQILYCVLERWTRTLNQIWHGKTDWRGSKVHQNTELWTQLIVRQWNSSGTSSQDSPHCRSATNSQSSCQNWAYNQTISLDGWSSCRSSTTSHGHLKTMKGNSNQALSSVLSIRKKSPGKWSFIGPGSEIKWYSTHEYKPQGEWDRVAEKMMVKFAESGHPVFRATSPLSRGTLKRKGGGKLSIHFCADQGKIETVFRTIISVNQLSFYGAVSGLWEECKTCHVRTGRPVLAGQSDPLFVPSVMKSHTLLTDDPAQEQALLQWCQERFERLSQQDRVIKFCTDAGFLTTVEVGQYFMTKDTEELSQFTDSVACREYTLPRDEDSSEPKGWDQREHQNWTRIGSHNQLPTR